MRGDNINSTILDLYTMICTMSDTTITVNRYKKIETIYNTISCISVIKLSENRVLVAYNYFNNYNEGAYKMVICTINNTSITSSAIVTIQSTKTNANIVPIKLSENKVFVIFSDTDNRYLSSMICAINEDTITLGTKVQLSIKNMSGSSIAAIKISENKIFIFHTNTDSIKKMYALICTINEDIITVGADTELKEFNYNYVLRTSLLQLSENKIFIYYNSNVGINILMCIINNNIIEKAEDIQLVDNKLQVSYENLIHMSAISMNNNEMFVVHNYSADFILQAIICIDEIYTEVNLLEKRSDDIYGIAKTNSTEGQKVDIYRPLLKEATV